MSRRIFLSLAVFLFAFSAFAQEARFFIERIDVRNAHRLSPHIVVSASLLREGKEYSEDELREGPAQRARRPLGAQTTSGVLQQLRHSTGGGGGGRPCAGRERASTRSTPARRTPTCVPLAKELVVPGLLPRIATNRFVSHGLHDT